MHSIASPSSENQTCSQYLRRNFMHCTLFGCLSPQSRGPSVTREWFIFLLGSASKCSYAFDDTKMEIKLSSWWQSHRDFTTKTRQQFLKIHQLFCWPNLSLCICAPWCSWTRGVFPIFSPWAATKPGFHRLFLPTGYLVGWWQIILLLELNSV